MTPAEMLPDRLRGHGHLHPESRELLNLAADAIDQARDVASAIVGGDFDDIDDNCCLPWEAA